MNRFFYSFAIAISSILFTSCQDENNINPTQIEFSATTEGGLYLVEKPVIYTLTANIQNSSEERSIVQFQLGEGKGSYKVGAQTLMPGDDIIHDFSKNPKLEVSYTPKIAGNHDLYFSVINSNKSKRIKESISVSNSEKDIHINAKINNQNIFLGKFGIELFSNVPVCDDVTVKIHYALIYRESNEPNRLTDIFILKNGESSLNKDFRFDNLKSVSIEDIEIITIHGTNNTYISDFTPKK